ncbi:MAG: hypothetical protein ACRDXX_05010 [Stackebrandtia sp.]
MTYPQYPDYDPYGQQPQQPTTGVPASPGPYGPPTTGVPASPAYGQPAYAQPGGYQSEPPPGERPTVVTAAAGAMMTTVALSLFAGVFSAASISAWSEAEDGRAATSSEALGMIIVVAFPTLLLAGVFVVLTLGVLRGSSTARVVAFVMYGIFLACNGCFSLAFAVDATDTAAEAVSHSVAAAISLGLLTIADVVAVVLLALPQSNVWFKAMARAKALR